MVKVNKHIEIVRSSIVSLSSMGQKSCDMIRAVLEEYYEDVGVTVVNDLVGFRALVAKQPDLVFLGLKSINFETGSEKDSATRIWLSKMLDEAGLNYTGSKAPAISLDSNKPMAKQVAINAGLISPAYFMASQGQYLSEDDLPFGFPLFVKPPNGGGGKGIGADSVVRDFDAFEKKVQSLSNSFCSDALVEKYLPGREFSVAVLEDSLCSDGLLAMPVELVTDKNDQGDRVLGQKIKSADTEHVVAVQDGSNKDAIVELAKRVFKVLGARDYGRIDIRLDENSVPHFLEANLVPGLAYHDFTSYFTSACWINQSMDYESMILRIVERGLSRDLLMNESVREISTGRGSLLQTLDKTLKPSPA